MIRALRQVGYSPRRRLFCYLFLVATLVSTILVSCISLHFPKEIQLEEHIAGIQARLQFLESLYRDRQEDILTLQGKILACKNKYVNHNSTLKTHKTTIPPRVTALLKNLTGTKAALGFHQRHVNSFLNSFSYQLMPHLMDHASSLRPEYMLRGDRQYSDVVIGIPTVKRDKESYILLTLNSLIESLSEEELKKTLIVVFIGETDVEYVVNLASEIEALFTKHVKDGLIEIISPSPYYYPDLDTLPLNFGDSAKRVKWRTKQNLDSIYLMAYAHHRGVYYLMLEDDVLAKKQYMQEIKRFTASTSVSSPNWFFIEFCRVGGIGKLFKSSNLIHFMTYVQLFYTNLPIDWLLASYVTDRVCTVYKESANCAKSKAEISPKYKSSLFQHIGVYSSLRGKIQKIEEPQYGSLPLFYPHKNPILKRIHTDIKMHGDHTAKRAYNGKTYFWGIKPPEGSVIEFWFKKPTVISRYIFRSGNVQHSSDKFSDTVVEVLPVGESEKFTVVDTFDEFGLADGNVARSFGPLVAIRLRVTRSIRKWVLLSEINLKILRTPSTRTNTGFNTCIGLAHCACPIIPFKVAARTSCSPKRLVRVTRHLVGSKKFFVSQVKAKVVLTSLQWSEVRSVTRLKERYSISWRDDATSTATRLASSPQLSVSVSLPHRGSDGSGVLPISFNSYRGTLPPEEYLGYICNEVDEKEMLRKFMTTYAREY